MSEEEQIHGQDQVVDEAGTEGLALERSVVQAEEQAAVLSQAGGKKITLQFIIFSLVGVLNTVVDLVVYWLLLQLSIYYVITNILSYGAGMLNSYIWNNNVTFRNKGMKERAAEGKKKSSAQIWRFVIWNGITLMLSSIIIAVLIELVGWSELWSKLIATVIIVIVQFTGMKKWVFRD